MDSDIPSDPPLDDALTGLIVAAHYCENHGHDTLSLEINELYQQLGACEMDADS